MVPFAEHVHLYKQIQYGSIRGKVDCLFDNVAKAIVAVGKRGEGRNLMVLVLYEKGFFKIFSHCKRKNMS